ncbi:MAG: hypothetical protein HYY02_04900 [Chloroflexi bacterium]|nr:hypothetical protein [Chloroflexota bacterium]
MRSRLLTAALLAAAGLLFLACGTARIDLKTTVLSPEELDHEMVIRADGLMGEAMRQAFTVEDFRKEGWQAESKSEGNAVTVTVSKRLKRGESLSMPASAGGPISSPNVTSDYFVSDGLLEREYRLQVDVPPLLTPTPAPSPTPRATATPPRTPTPLGRGGLTPAATPTPRPTVSPFRSEEFERLGEQLGEQFVRSALRMSWTVSLPGEVNETNADSRTATSGTWEIGYDRLKQGFQVSIASKERKNLWPFVGGGLVAVVVGGLAAYAFRRRRHGETAVPDGTARDGPNQP